MPKPSDKLRQLQGCINDLVSLLALPALWAGSEPPQVIDTLFKALMRILDLDFAYARLNESPGIAASEHFRVKNSLSATPNPAAVGRALTPWLTLCGAGARSAVPNPIGDGPITIACAWLGPGPERGVIVAASQRIDFPTDIESLLFRTAVNQAVIEVQRAEVAGERSRTKAVEQSKNQVLAENTYLRQELASEASWDNVVGDSQAWKNVQSLAEQVAPTKAAVLIQGETGTGKELIARGVHQASERKERAFVRLNCAAIPTGLLEAELFGHEKGAYTGAVGQSIGRFELANRGTIFLDEVSEIPLELQAKLLRVLQEQEFERLGSTRTIRVDVRVVAATNRDLLKMIAEGTFRDDLYYRLNVFPIVIPPLRERLEDIPRLVRHFTAFHARRYKKSISDIPEETLNTLCQYGWPGNVREMANLIERSVILSRGPTLEVPLGELKGVTESPCGSALVDLEREHILRVLDETGWVVGGPSGAAVKLGIKRTSLQYKMQKLGIVRPNSNP